MDPRIQRDFERHDNRILTLRYAAAHLRTNQLGAESLVREALGKDWLFQVALGEYILDFLHLDLGVDVEIDGSPHSSRGRGARSRRDADRAWSLYKAFGVCTIRFYAQEVHDDLDDVLERIHVFCQKPVAPTKWVPTAEDLVAKETRRQELAEARRRIAEWEASMVGYPRKDVVRSVDEWIPSDDIDTRDVLPRLRKRIWTWPEEGYALPGLQTISAKKLQALKKNSTSNRGTV